MKKKILSLVLAVLLIVPAMFMLTACNQAPSIIEVSTYDEIVAALNQDKQIIKLKNDISSTKSIYITKKVTLDLNGKTLTGNGYDGVLYVDVTGDLTIKGNGKVVALGGYDVDKLYAEDTDKSIDEYTYAVWARGGKVVIENGEFTNVAIKDDDHYDLIYASQVINKETKEVVASGHITILGGKYKNVTPKWTLNLQDNTQAKIVVKGGRFVNYDPANSLTEPDGVAANFVAEGYVAREYMGDGEGAERGFEVRPAAE